MNFQEKLSAINSLLCVGLDHGEFTFNKTIIDQTHDLVCAYKPNSAFFESKGAAGIEELKKTCDYITQHFPEIAIILDAKRADIGNTNNGYVEFAFDYLGVDAITLHPYLGREALEPFLKREDKGLIILCRTSNPGAGEFQDLVVDGEPLYQKVAKQVVSWNTHNNCLLVVGATYPQQVGEVRKITGDMTFLVPGIGAQGGDLEKTMKLGLNSKKAGLIINSSRGIIFAENPREEAMKLRDQINIYRKE